MRSRYFGYNLTQFGNIRIEGSSDFCSVKTIYAKDNLITGASSGLGKATTKLFQSKGWNVIAAMRSPENEKELTKLHLFPISGKRKVECLSILHPKHVA
ncbi:hypothetical protein A4D02_24975 [Niastella koreensis]|uniref:Short-chain dehydrogenase/reductase SDR n=1 Tax=Niastella koreensis TaxID=354356 RepID=A0ABX3P4T4_9BACT|nr:hypothetical protein A4D02_24975 [Niastella koreensis]